MTFRPRPDNGGTPRFVLPVLDLTSRSDAQLARLRALRIVAIAGWTVLAVLGFVGAAVLVGRPFLQVFAFAAILAGLIDVGLAIGGLVRVILEQRTRAFERSVRAHEHPRFHV